MGWLHAPGASDGNLDVAALKLMTTPSFQNMLFVEIPEYRNKHVRTPVKVNFYVINGKRKRSQPQHFTYHPGGSSPAAPVGRQRERVGEDPGVCCWLGDLRLVVQPAWFPHLANGAFLRELHKSGAQQVLSTANWRQQCGLLVVLVLPFGKAA